MQDQMAAKQAAYEETRDEIPVSPIEDAFLSLEAAVERMDKQVGMMIETLTPILAPSPPHDEINAVPVTSDVPVAARIQRLTRGLHEIADRLAANRERLAL